MKEHFNHLRFIHYLLIISATITLVLGITPDKKRIIDAVLEEMDVVKAGGEKITDYESALKDTIWLRYENSSPVIKAVAEAHWSGNRERAFYPSATEFEDYGLKFQGLVDQLYVDIDLPISTIAEFRETLKSQRWVYDVDVRAFFDELFRKTDSVAQANKITKPFNAVDFYGHIDLIFDSDQKAKNDQTVSVSVEYPDTLIDFNLLVPIKSDPLRKNYRDWLVPYLKKKDSTFSESQLSFVNADLFWTEIKDKTPQEAVDYLLQQKNNNNENVQVLGLTFSPSVAGLICPVLLLTLMLYYFVNSKEVVKRLREGEKHDYFPYFGVYEDRVSQVATFCSFVVLPPLSVLFIAIRSGQWTSAEGWTGQQGWLSAVFFLLLILGGMVCIQNIRELRKSDRH